MCVRCFGRGKTRNAIISHGVDETLEIVQGCAHSHPYTHDSGIRNNNAISETSIAVERFFIERLNGLGLSK